MFEQADGDEELADRLNERGAKLFAGMNATFERVSMPSGIPAAPPNTR
jgi:hypothetical protein